MDHPNEQQDAESPEYAPDACESEAQPAPASTTRSGDRIVLTVALSLVVAVIIVVVAVMPAEYGIDPTGVGKLLGLTALNEEAPRRGHGELPAAAGEVGPLASAVVPPQSNEGSVTLQPGESIEVKADMIGGQGFSYSWSAEGGAVEVDMHGVDDSYLQAQNQTGDQGVFIAPADGLFGWYWVNRGQTPVVITLRTSGYYRGIVRTEIVNEAP